MKKLGNVYKPVKGKKPLVLFDGFKEGLVPYLSAHYFRTGKASQWVDPYDKNYVPVEPENVVILWDGSNSGDVFTGLRGALSSTMSRLDGDASYDDKFTYYYLKTKFHVLNTQTTGSTIPHVNGSVLKNLEMPSIDVETQAQIVLWLDTIRSAIQVQESIGHKLQELKKSMMRHLFTYGTQNEKTKQTEIGEIPYSWRVARFGDLASFKNGINFTKTQKGSVGTKTIDVFNMYGRDDTSVRLDRLYSVNKKIGADHLLRNDDLLFVRSSLKQEGIGRVCHFVTQGQERYSYCGFIIRARIAERSDIDPEFLALFFRTDQAHRNLIANSGKVAITNISQDALKMSSIPIPPVAEQKAIVAAITAIDNKIKVEKQKYTLMQQLFSSILNQLMSDKIEVT